MALGVQIKPARGLKPMSVRARFDRRHECPAVFEIDLEVVVTQTGEQLPFLRQRDLILCVKRGDVGRYLVVGIRGVLTEAGSDRVRIGSGYRDAGGGAEETGIAFVVAVLVAEFHAGEQRVLEAAGGKFRRQVGLVESVEALVVVVVRGKRQRPGGSGGASRIDVLIKLVIARDAEGVLQLRAVAEVVVEHGGEAIDVRVRGALAALPKKVLVPALNGAPFNEGTPRLGTRPSCRCS